MAIACGRHALQLAESLAAQIRVARKTNGRVHLFIAGPNAFTFFLGQQRPSLGTPILYEYDFEGTRGGSYKASLSLTAYSTVTLFARFRGLSTSEPRNNAV